MLILLSCLLVICMVVSVILTKKSKPVKDNKFNLRDLFFALSCLFGCLAFMISAISVGLFISVDNEWRVDNRINRYQHENEIIEQNIDTLLEKYLESQPDISIDLEVEESSIILISLFPELKNDFLVKEQLETYIENEEKIKYLEEVKQQDAKMKWLLFFGK